MLFRFSYLGSLFVLFRINRYQAEVRNILFNVSGLGLETVCFGINRYSYINRYTID